MCRIIPLLVASMVFLNGCSYEDLQSSLIPEAESTFAKEFLQKLHDREFEYVRTQIDSSLINDANDENLLEIAEYFPSGELISVEIIGSQVHTFNSQWQGHFTFEYHFSDGWAVASAVMKRTNEKLSVVGFNVYQTPASQQELTAFSAVDATPLRIAVLFLTIAIPVFMIFTCWTVYRTPIPMKKKRWYLISFIGLFKLSFNWTSGGFAYQLLTVQLLGAGMSAAGHSAPWILTFTMPVGAVWFWIKRNDLVNRTAPEIDNQSQTERTTEEA